MALTLTPSAIVNSTCGASTGAVTLTGSVAGNISLDGGAPQVSPHTYTGLIAGTHTASFTDGTCTVTTTFNIDNVLSNLSASLTSQTNPSCNGGTGSVTVTGSGGVGTLGYVLDGGISQVTGNFSGIPVGSHVVKVTDSNGCYYTVNFSITEPDLLVLHLASQANVSCFGGTNGYAMVVASGGTPAYAYSILSQPVGGAATISVNSITGMKAGTYVIRVTDSKGCFQDLSVVITQPATALDITTIPAVKVNPGCSGASTGSIDITLTGGVAPYVYAWSNGYNGQDLTNVPAGSYTLIVTDVNGCTITGGPYVITAPLPIVLSPPVITNANCSGAFSGGVTLGVASGGTAPFTYLLSTGATNNTGIFSSALSAGGYTYTVTDAHGCMANGSFQITDPTLLTVSITSQTNETCFPADNGTASVTALGGTGPYSFSWTGSVTQASTTANPNLVTGLAAGTYIVTVTDSKGCVGVQTITITQPANLNPVVVSKIDATCIGGTNGVIVMGATGGTAPFIYTSPGLTFVGNTASNISLGSYVVTVTDINGCNNSITVNVAQSACYPKAVEDNIVVQEDSSVSGNVISNDSDPNGLPLKVISYNIGGTNYNAGTTTIIPGVGTILVNSNGTYTFTPVINYKGPVPVINYVVSNGFNTANADMNITIIPFNHVPVAKPDNYNVPESTLLKGDLGANDTLSGDGGNIWSVVTPPAHGNVVVNVDGTFNYMPVPNFSGPDSFTYKLCDTDGDCSSTTVSINVSGINHKPVAVDDVISTLENTPVSVKVLKNDSFGADGPSQSAIAIVTQPNNGKAVVNNGGTPNDPTDDYVIYTPNMNFDGVDNFIYQICDSNGDCDQATVTVFVIWVNDVPIAAPDKYTTDEDVPLTGNLALNDRPSNDGGNVWTVVSKPSHGSLVINPDGTFTYLPDPNFNGTDSFYYKVCDVNGDCSQARVDLTINPVNDPPVAVDDYATTPEHKPVSGNVLTNDTDVEKDPLTVTQFNVSGDNGVHYPGVPVNIPNVGSIVIDSKGAYTFTPSGYFSGNVPPITYSISDGKGGTAFAVLYIKVIPVNDPPIAVNDFYPVIEGKDVTGDVTLNDSDPNGDLISVTTMPVRPPQHGTVTLLPNGKFTYKPVVGYIGTDTFVYELCDNGSPILCSTAVVTLTITKDVDCDVLVPTSFSPNGDGIHDLFEIRCLYNYENPKIEVFNRWGNKVYVKEHYGDINIWGSPVSAWWDGRSNQKNSVSGAELPVGTYFYILTLNSSKILNGYIYLNR